MVGRTTENLEEENIVKQYVDSGLRRLLRWYHSGIEFGKEINFLRSFRPHSLTVCPVRLPLGD